MTRILPHTRAAARVRRHAMTPQERRLWAELRALNRMLGTNFRRQAPVGRFVADFAEYGRRIVVEVDGGRNGEAADARSDAVRDAWLADQGFAVLRFWNNEVGANMEGVMQAILDALEAAQVTPPPPPSPTRGEGGADPSPPAHRQRMRGPLPPRGGGRGWGGCPAPRREDAP